jgi:radical SAM protein with 4Fe4S-binding SPASM domain
MRFSRGLSRLGRTVFDYRRRAVAPAALPLRLWIETSSRCNLRCPMCPNRTLPPGEQRLMDMGLFVKIIDEAKAFARDAYLHHRGEPLLNPALVDMIVCAREAGLRTRLHTNGTLLDAFAAERLLKARPDLVCFSVDGFERTAYGRIREGATFETTVDNLIRFVGMRRLMGLDRPYIAVEKLRFRHPKAPEDAAQVKAFWQRLVDAGVDEVVERDEFVWAEESAPEPAEARPPAAVCNLPWCAMVVCADGAVTPCPRDFRAAMKMGNVRDASLEAIWRGEAYQDLRRRSALDIESLPLCRKCDRLRRRLYGDMPFPHMSALVVDELAGYGALRRRLWNKERK